MEVVRSFVAVNLAPEVRKALDSIEVKLKERPFRFIKWVEPGNIHMTLKFLGDVPQDKISLIARAITDTVEPMAEFCLRLEALGAFPNWQRPQVIWVGVGGELDRLVAVQRELEEALFKLGFPRENRRFSPHLTLGRIRDQASANDRRQLADSPSGNRSPHRSTPDHPDEEQVDPWRAHLQ